MLVKSQAMKFIVSIVVGSLLVSLCSAACSKDEAIPDKIPVAGSPEKVMTSTNIRKLDDGNSGVSDKSSTNVPEVKNNVPDGSDRSSTSAEVSKTCSCSEPETVHEEKATTTIKNPAMNRHLRLDLSSDEKSGKKMKVITITIPVDEEPTYEEETPSGSANKDDPKKKEKVVKYNTKVVKSDDSTTTPQPPSSSTEKQPSSEVWRTVAWSDLTPEDGEMAPKRSKRAAKVGKISDKKRYSKQEKESKKSKKGKK